MSRFASLKFTRKAPPVNKGGEPAIRFSTQCCGRLTAMHPSSDRWVLYFRVPITVSLPGSYIMINISAGVA
jgi:hypothetical protein